MPKIRVNGIEMYYEDTGQGAETVVFSHGLLWSRRMFAAQVEALKDKYRVIAFDHRGQGDTEVTPDGYDMDTLTQDALALIQALGVAPVHFAGLSMGGFVGMRLAARHPQVVRSLILMETTADPEPEENIPRYRLLNFIARWIGMGVVANSVMKIMFSQSFLNDPNRQAERDYWKRQLLQNHRIGITRAVKGVIDRKGIYEELGNIHCPTLIIVGEEDVATVPMKSERIHAAIPHSRLVRIPAAGHSSTVEQPERVTQAIREFLGQL